jgi:hypothetical protein
MEFLGIKHTGRQGLEKGKCKKKKGLFHNLQKNMVIHDKISLKMKPFFRKNA